jgi:hypothetical protein
MMHKALITINCLILSLILLVDIRLVYKFFNDQATSLDCLKLIYLLIAALVFNCVLLGWGFSLLVHQNRKR